MRRVVPRLGGAGGEVRERGGEQTRARDTSPRVLPPSPIRLPPWTLSCIHYFLVDVDDDDERTTTATTEAAGEGMAAWTTTGEPPLARFSPPFRSLLCAALLNYFKPLCTARAAAI